MRILVVGTGAVGGYFGGRLLAAGRDVTFLVRPHRVAELARTGIDIRSPFGDVHVAAPPTITPEAVRPEFDLILVSSKAQDLAGAIESFAPAVGTRTAILPLLNGLRQLDTLDARFGAGRVLGGVCFISAVRQADGRIVHFNDIHRLSFGERDGSLSPRIQEIDAALSNAGFEAHCTQRIVQEMWNKWVFIATLAGITCLMRAAIGDIVAAGASQLALQMLDECSAIAAREGVPPTASSMRKNREIFTKPGSQFTASMLRDMESHAPIESEHIVGDLLRRGEKHGIEAPLLRIAYAHLGCYEARRIRESG